MVKKYYYNIEKNVDKIIRGGYTNFLDPSMVLKVRGKLKGYGYKIFYPYTDCDKVILYTTFAPSIRVFEILCDDKLSHREIMGSLFGLNIDSEMFGDIVIFNGHYYIMAMDSIYNLIIHEFNMVGSKKIRLKEVSIDVIYGYERKYKEIELTVSSVRIDVVIARLIGTSRDQVKKKFYNDEIILNYEVCRKNNYNLCDGDIFSVRKSGKYKFDGVVKMTKRDNYIIKLYKYIDG